MPLDLTAGIVRILLGPHKATVGTGFVLNAEGLVVTCAHVVKGAQAGPGDTIWLIFYAAKDKREREATVLPEYWRASNAEDVAFLRLKEKIPEGVEPLPLGRYRGKHNFSTFGFPEVDSTDGRRGPGLASTTDGRRGAGFVLGPPHEMWGFARLQLRSEETTKGFSGAPVWDDELQTVIGIVIGIGSGRSIKWDRQEYYLPSDPHGRFQYEAFATPTDTLWKIYPDLRPADQCPYRSLETFTKSDTLYFFGRERVLDELVKRLQHEPRFLAVLGPSGCGKSSLVQAGLLPRLEKEAVYGSNEWQIIITRPTDPTFENTITSLQQKQQHIGLVIDQFEGLFGAYSEEQCQEMITLLNDLLEGSLRLHLILLLRNDFYGHFVRFEALEKWLKKGMVNVPSTLQSEEVRDIIEKPAEIVRLGFDEGLVELVAKDVLEMYPSSGSKESGALNTVLPLLEFALKRLWERRNTDQGKLTLAAYRTIGGVTGGLRQWADEVYTALTEKERELARRIFTQLVYVNDETLQIPYSCRRRLKDELISTIAGEQGMVEQVLQQLITARLLVTNQIDEHATIELSHEALIREWPKLRDLLNEARGDILFQQSLSQDVMEWEQRKGRQKQARDLLYRGDKLKQAKKWAGRNIPNKQEAAFIQASATRQTLSLVSLIVVVLVLVSSLGIAGWFVFFQPSKTLVTTLQDSEVGSLRWCINNSPSGSTIRFAQGMRGIIELTGGDLVIGNGKHLTLLGPGVDRLTISGGDTDAKIHVSKGATLDVSHLSFKNSQTILIAFFYNEGSLIVRDSIISNNKESTAAISYGGAMTNAGTLTVIGSTISNNTAEGDDYGQGGGIFNQGQLIVNNSTIRDNQAISNNGKSYGGAINNFQGSVTVISSILSNNTARSSGNNPSSEGGAISNQSQLIVNNSTIRDNQAISDTGITSGGGIYNYSSGILTVTSSTFSNNSATGKQGEGGGIDNEGQITVISSTFSNNSASSNNGSCFGAGILNLEPGKGTVTNSTFSENIANGSRFAWGGGIDNEGQITVTHSTISRNTAVSGNGHSFGGGMANHTPDMLVMTSTIVAANSALNGPDISGVLNAGDYNLIQNFAGFTSLNAPTDRQVTLSNLKLASTLGNNGGSTQTLALQQGSQAIDAVPLQACSIAITDASGRNLTITTDQRGNSRPDGSESACDSGAYESSY